MKRKYWLLIASVITSTILLYACNSGLPDTLDVDTPVNEETPVVEPSDPPVETAVAAETDDDTESPALDYTLPPLEDPESITYDQVDLTLNAMTINLLHVIKSFDLDSNGEIEEINLIARDFPSPDVPQETYEEYEIHIKAITYRGYPYNFEPRFNIVDLDKTDRYREIAVSAYGESDDNATTFIKYDGISLKEIGTVPGFYGKRYVDGNPTEGLGNLTIDGSGVISTVQTSFFLMTWSYDTEYRFEDGTTLTEIQKDLYPLDHEVTMLTDLTLGKSRTDQMDGITLRKGEVVTLKECDNKKWVSVMNSAGEIGWFAVDEANTVIGTGKPATEVFDGLFIAG